MYTRASEEERQRFSFERLDLNRSGKLERDDVVASMERQLQLARTITPLVIAQQLRARAVYGGVGHEQLLEEANSLAQGAIDDMASQIERTVDDLYAQVDLDANGAISFGEWQTAWEGSAEVRAMFDGTELIRSSASAAVRRD